MFFNMSTLVNAIIIDVRSKCQKLGFHQGAIGISFVPESEEARKWANSFRSDMSVDFMVPVMEDEDYLLEYDGHIVGNAAGVVGMKIAATKQVMDINRKLEVELTSAEQCTSGKFPAECANQYGVTNWKGGVAIPVLRNKIYEPTATNERFLIIYVAVSGDEDEEKNEEAAWAALDVVKRVIGLDGEYIIPDYMNN